MFGTQRTLSAATVGLWGLVALTSAFAAPPAVRPKAAQTFQPSLATRLDLRAPTHAIESSDAVPTAFPSLNHRQSLDVQVRTQLSGFVKDSPQARPPIEQLVRKVRTEGLPVARLWETKSSLVHLGLNQKGKPGLWLVQKLH
jgi:hypothetical protein